MKQEIIYLVSKKHKQVCKVLNYIEHSFILISTIIGCVSISAFASLIGVLRVLQTL